MTRLFSFCIVASLALPASAETANYGVAYLGSWHIGADELNNVNPGLGLGRRWAARREGIEFHLEGGVFFNSYEEVSPLLLGGASMQVAEIGPGSLRLGASLGVARYEALADYLEESYGIPNVEGFIPIGALTAYYRWGDMDVRLTTVPPGEGVDAILNLSVARSF